MNNGLCSNNKGSLVGPRVLDYTKKARKNTKEAIRA